MKRVTQIIVLFMLSAAIISCNPKPRIADSCMENSGKGKLLVFIGQKIDLQRMKTEKPEFDAKFVARYKILEIVCGNYSKDTIDFTVYDHYGRPPFEQFSTVMLYLVEDSGKYTHVKYQFNELYKTKNGRWASPLSYDDQGTIKDTNNPVKPVRLEFEKEVSYDIAKMKKQDRKEYYPEPYYRIDGGKAIAVYGNYVDELFEIKKRGALREHGYFGVPDTTKPFQVKSMVFAFGYEVTKNDKILLLRTWKELLNAIEKNDIQKIKQLSLDSVKCSICEGFATPHFFNDVEPIETFISATNSILPGSELWENIRKGKYELGATNYEGDIQPTHFRLKKPGNLVIYEVSFKTYIDFGVWYNEQTHKFEFVKINDGLKFYGVESQ